MKSRVGWLAVLAANCLAQDAAELLARSVGAERSNTQRMARYLFREDVRQRYYDSRGKLTSDHSLTYEVLIIEGRPYHRRIAMDEVPLSPEDDAKEQERMERVAAERRGAPNKQTASERRRRVVPYDQLGRLHQVKLAGEEIIAGRSCYVLQAEPRRGAKPRTRDEERLLRSEVRVWMDRQTLHRVRMALTGGEETTFEFAQHDGDIWLISRILSRTKQGKATLETEQVYSDYRRFSSESSIRVR
jgi:hypothetical protein